MTKLLYYIHSLFFCLRYLPFKQAVKVPILVWHDVKVKSLHRGDIILTGEIKKATILLGFEGAKGRDTHPMYIHIKKGGHLYLGNNINIARGTSIVIESDSNVTIGNGFFCNGNCVFYSNRSIKIKDNCLFGWNIELNTTDGHTMIYDGEEKPSSGDITLNEHVWVCSDCIISKNVTIAKDCVVGRRSLVTKSQLQANSLIAGTPAMAIKTNLKWKA